jgi:hypothetical protein
MKKSFLATSKKVLLATSFLAMSSTAIAADVTAAENSTRNADSTIDTTMSVTANYVELLTVGFDLATINFGDVFEGATVNTVDVTATITGDALETFTYLVTTPNAVVTLGSESGSDTALTGGSTDVVFQVGIDTSIDGVLTEDITAQIVTMTINYDSIMGTGTTDKV